MCTKENNLCCCIFSIIASILLGVGVAAVFSASAIATIAVLFYITLIIGIISLLILIFLLYCNRGKGCFCINNHCLIITAVGAIISSIFALTAVTGVSIAAAILVGVVTFFLISNIVNLIEFIICLLCTRRCD